MCLQRYVWCSLGPAADGHHWSTYSKLFVYQPDSTKPSAFFTSRASFNNVKLSLSVDCYRIHCLNQSLHSPFHSGSKGIIRTAYFTCLVVYNDMLLIYLQTRQTFARQAPSNRPAIPSCEPSFLHTSQQNNYDIQTCKQTTSVSA